MPNTTVYDKLLQERPSTIYFPTVEGSVTILYRKSLTAFSGLMQTANGSRRIQIPAIRLASGQAIMIRKMTHSIEKSQLVEAMDDRDQETDTATY